MQETQEKKYIIGKANEQLTIFNYQRRIINCFHITVILAFLRCMKERRGQVFTGCPRIQNRKI